MSGSAMGRELGDVVGRELDRLAEEVRACPGERALWIARGNQGNPPGTLALHLVGNLSHYIGAHLGQTGYVRDRPAEFGDCDLSKKEILDRISTCRAMVVPVLESLTDDQLDREYPGDAPERMRGVSTRGYLIHTIWHLGWHLGQMYYHRLGEQSPE